MGLKNRENFEVIIGQTVGRQWLTTANNRLQYFVIMKM